LLRGLGAGDLKLLAAVGGVGGGAFALQAGVLAGIVGGLLALGYALVRFRQGQRGRAVWRATFPFAPAIAAGAVTAVVWTG
jgi:prepilin peptidase CpaA